MTTYIEGMDELQASIRRLGNLKQADVTKVAKKGANIAFRDARLKAPKLTGTLRKGIVLKGERARGKGKKVYQVTFNNAMNDIFQKRTRTGYAYYPASQEYGFILRNGQRKEGTNFMKKSLEDNANRITRTITDEMTTIIETALRGR